MKQNGGHFWKSIFLQNSITNYKFQVQGFEVELLNCIFLLNSKPRQHLVLTKKWAELEWSLLWFQQNGGTSSRGCMYFLWKFGFLNFYVMCPTEIDLYGIAHVKVDIIPRQKIHVIPILGRFVWTTSFVQCGVRFN